MRRRSLLVAAGAFVAPSARALYDPPPLEQIALAQGDWHGTLTYRDYGAPNRLVTLPTRLSVALGSPNELVLHYAFDDGPGKRVHAYELMRFDFERQRITWLSGVAKRSESGYRIVATGLDGTTRRIVFEGGSDVERERFTLTIGESELTITKEEFEGTAEPRLRNAYRFSRAADAAPRS